MIKIYLCIKIIFLEKKIKYFLNNNSEEIENKLENKDNLIKSKSENKISENKINFQNYF